MSAEEVEPVEVIILNVKCFGGISSTIVTLAPAIIKEDGVGTGNLLELGVCVVALMVSNFVYTVVNEITIERKEQKDLPGW